MMKFKNPMLIVTDIDRSVAFYRKVFGLRVIMDFGANKTLTGGLALQTLETWQEFIGTDNIVFGNNNFELNFEEDDFVEPEDIQKLSKDKYLINGTTDLEEVQDVLNIPLPIDEFETFGGYILDCYGKLPEDGSTFDIDLKDIHVHVKNMTHHRIDQMIVYKKEVQDEP